MPKFGELDAYAISISILIILRLNFEKLDVIVLAIIVLIVGYVILKSIYYAVSKKIPDRIDASLILSTYLTLICFATFMVFIEYKVENLNILSIINGIIIFFGVIRAYAISRTLKMEKYTLDNYFEYKNTTFINVVFVTIFVCITAVIGIYTNLNHWALFLAMSETSRLISHEKIEEYI
ncbi:MAG: hypothetical protein ABIJ10_06745 [Candidatus Micrarchaeota archaeon]